MNKKIKRLRQEEKRLTSQAHILLQAKKLFMLISIIGMSFWTLVLIVNRDLALDHLWIELVNFILIATVFFLDIEQQYSEKAADQKREDLKETVLINSIKHGIKENKKYDSHIRGIHCP